jgi:hypothetical protein
MAIRRITISVPEELAEQIKKAAGDQPVSQYVTELLEAELSQRDLERQWLEFYREANPSPEDREWAEALMRQLAEPDDEPDAGSADGASHRRGVGAA